ncbi:MAG: VCBS repeat-containing protein [Saprospiraceae bacterium]|nr:VCBS repeat-containing protein [Lewinella sp.]
MRKTILLITAAACVFLAFSKCSLDGGSRAEARFRQYCGACHVAPDPASLPKHLWTEQVLPEMAARLGLKIGDYDPFAGLDMEEAHFVKYSNAYPEKPLISESEWEGIQNYILSMAPDSLEVDVLRNERSQELTRFRPRPISVDNMPGGLVTALYYDSLGQQWWVGSRGGEWYSLQGDEKKVVQLFGSPISGFDRVGDQTLVMEMGYMNPSDVPRGKLWLFEDGRQQLIAEPLFRPVFAKIFDAEHDGRNEYLVCEFGNHAGRLMLWQWDGERYAGRPLLNVPGSIRIQEADMNKDGKTDLIVLAAQGDESIHIFYNQGDGSFSHSQPIRLPPIYGSSWFELFDYEGDGDLDIAIVNGDNADYTYALKPYHGLRLYLNDGKDQFEEAFFYPIYGATRLVARDFDRDGDVDFAVTALFPDFERAPREAFVYLENQDTASYRFQSYTGDFALEGRWMVMEAGDFEQDGDIDIVLGSYVISPTHPPDSLRRIWAAGNVDLLLLENQSITSSGVSEPTDH